MPRARLPFDSYVEKSHGCWRWVGALNGDGYGSFRGWKAHRFAWKAVNGPVPRGMCVCHRCDNPHCVNPEHLFLGTVGDNNRDRAAKGRSKGTFRPGADHPGRKRRGERHWGAKLSSAAVVEIRRRRVLNEPVADLAAEFGVHHSTISRIARREWRKEVP